MYGAMIGSFVHLLLLLLSNYLGQRRIAITVSAYVVSTRLSRDLRSFLEMVYFYINEYILKRKNNIDLQNKSTSH